MSSALVHQEFFIQTDYPFQQIFIEINGVDFTNCASQKGKTFSEPLITDQEGRLRGDLIIFDPLGLNILSTPGIVNVNFVVREEIEEPVIFRRTEGNRNFQLNGGGAGGTTISTRKVVAATLPMKIITSGMDSKPVVDVGAQNPILTNDPGTTNTINNTEVSVKENTSSSVLLPMAQTFFVDASTYPNGVFTTSAELYFSEKSTSDLHVMVDLREVIDGVPTTRQLSGSYSTLNKNSIQVPTNVSDGPTVATKFKFSHPIYLHPGKEYALTVKPPDEKYKIFTNVVGGLRLNNGTTVSTKQPNVGKLYKLTNTLSQVEEQSTSLVFKINKAVFETGSKSFVKQTSNLNPVRFNYNLSEIDVVQKVFGTDALTSVDMQTKNYLTNSTVDYVNVPWNSPYRHSQIKTVTEQGDVKVRVILTNKDKNISPIVDTSSLALYTIKYEIDDIDSASTIRESEKHSDLKSNLGKAKYISKIVTLNPDFDSTGMEIKLDVNRKNNTDVDVFCRVKSSLDNGVDSTIEKRPWRYVPLYSSANSVSTSSTNYSVINPSKASVGTSEVAYVSETYRILESDASNLAYTADVGGVNAYFNSFNQFQVKIVMYGDNENSLVPKVKNLIATAVL